MENKSSTNKNFLRLSHLPTLILITGYISYWIELYFIKKSSGLTSPLAWIVFVSLSFFAAFSKKTGILKSFFLFMSGFRKQKKITMVFFSICFAMILFMLCILFYAYLLPPHLTQEFDALNYHLTLPRQHLIANSFQHIKWSSADLFLLPLDFALAPYCLTSELPSKFIHFFFLLGLILVSMRLVERFSKAKFLSICLIIFGIFGSHFIGIQMGTAMLDIILCYLFIAALDSFLDGRVLLSALEFSFFFWSKPFIPLQIIFICLLTLFVWTIFKKMGVKETGLNFNDILTKDTTRAYTDKLKMILISFIVFSTVIAGPFLIKSVYYSGTPLFPFAPGFIDINKNIDKNSCSWNSILTVSKIHLTTKDGYGYGRSPTAFIKHFWLIAVPEKGVNNKYDYPVGLMYLLFLGPFLYLLFISFKKKKVVILPFISIAYWISWWFGSQQTRFLYIPVLIMLITVSSKISHPSKVLMVTIIISLFLNTISVFRANTKDLGADTLQVLRAKDREILKLNTAYLQEKRRDSVYLDYYDVAYACFPVIVTGNKSRWVLQLDK